MTIYAYCRVSKQDGMDIENQVHAISEWAKKQNLSKPVFFKDDCSGDTPIEKREQLPILLNNLQKGDTVVVVEVFRLYRGFSGLPKIYRIIVEEKQANIVTLNEKEALLCTNYGNYDNDDIMQKTIKEMILLFMALFSELEKKNISIRTKRALEKRREEDHITLGRPQIKKPARYDELFQEAKEGKRTHASVMRELGLKRTTYYELAKKTKEK